MAHKDMHAYLIKGIYQWAIDSHLTPYVEIDAEPNYVTLPREYVKDGRITLNISPQAVRNFNVDARDMSFQTCFGGIIRQVRIPLFMIMRIYAYETGIGMAFREKKEDIDYYPLASNMRGRPKLQLVETEEKKDEQNEENEKNDKK